MALTAEMKTRIEERVNTGILDMWYPVAKSVEIRADRRRHPDRKVDRFDVGSRFIRQRHQRKDVQLLHASGV